ncbi:gluconokinase, partial [Xanthomonas vesicatoria]
MDTAVPATPASASPLAIVVMGVSGSGKTTIAQALAAHYRFRFLDADDYHSVAARAQMAAGQPLTDAMRLPWVELLAATLRDCVHAGESVVLAFSG